MKGYLPVGNSQHNKDQRGETGQRQFHDERLGPVGDQVSGVQVQDAYFNAGLVSNQNAGDGLSSDESSSDPSKRPQDLSLIQSESQVWSQEDYQESTPASTVDQVYTEMKLLENKYLDLAHFYKDQVVFEREKTSRVLQRIVQAPANKQQRVVDTYTKEAQARKEEGTVHENAMIKGLVKIKSSLEGAIQDLKQAVVNVPRSQQESAPDLVPKSSYTAETHRFLHETLSEVLGELDKAQVQALHTLSTKQYDMFDIASKHSMPATLRNDFLGQWYDAKTSVSQSLSDLKTALALRQQMADCQFQLHQSGVPISRSLKSCINQTSSPELGQLLASKRYFYQSVTEPASRKLKQLSLALKAKSNESKAASQKTRVLLNELAQALQGGVKVTTDQTLMTRSSVSPLGYSPGLTGQATGQNATEERQSRRMSPFQGRTYQHQSLRQPGSNNMSAQTSLRKSGSRAGQGQNGLQGNGFYTDHTHAVSATELVGFDLKNAQAKLVKFFRAQEEANLASKQKDKYQSELLGLLEVYLIEQKGFFVPQAKVVDETESTGRNALDELRDLVTQERSSFAMGLHCSAISDFPLTYGLIANGDHNLAAAESSNNEVAVQENNNLNQSRSMSQVNKVRSQRIQDLQESNDQLFSELRKANEKYLDVRVENNKLKDQNQTLKQTIEQLKTSQQSSSAQSRQRAISSSGGGTYTAAGAKKKVAEVVAEAQPATTLDSELRKQHDTLKSEAHQVCTQVKTFMAAMRALQKAVTRKVPDMTDQKKAFDSAKRDLEDSVVQTLTKLQAEDLQQLQASTATTPSAKTKSVSAMRSNNAAQSQQWGQGSREVSGQRLHTAGSRPSSVQAYGVSNNLASKQRLALSRGGRDDDANLNLLTRQVRSLTLEKDKMRELITELKQTNELYSSERDILEGKLKSKTAQLHKFASQCQANAHKVFMLESILADYKYQLLDLSQHAGVREALQAGSGRTTLEEIRATLDSKEESLKAKCEEEVARILVNLKVDPQFVALRDELASQVKLKEKLLEQQYEQLTFRVAEKEADLQRLKLLFVEKLREVQSSFAEISHEVVETTDKVTQDVTAKRQQDLQALLQGKAKANSAFDRSMADILSNYDKEETQKQMEELIQANHELMEANESLKAQNTLQEAQLANGEGSSNADPNDEPSVTRQNNLAKKESLHAEMVIELNEQIDEAKQECDNVLKQLKLSQGAEALQKKEIQGLKYDNKRMVMDLKDSKERFEKVKLEYHQQFTALKTNTVQMQQKLQKEYDARTTNEMKYLAVQKQLKIARQENAELQTETLLLMKRNEDLLAEQAFLKELRDFGDSDDLTDDGDDNADSDSEPEGTSKATNPDGNDKNGTDEKKKSDGEDEQEEFSPESKKIEQRIKRRLKREMEESKEVKERIEEDPTEAALFYSRLLGSTKAEYKALVKQHAKTNDLGNQVADLNTQLEQLELEKADLKTEVVKAGKGTRLVICLQNHVRKLLQDKLNDQAQALESAKTQSSEAEATAQELRAQASKLADDHQEALTSSQTQVKDLTDQIEAVQKQLAEAQAKQDTMADLERQIKEQEAKIGAQVYVETLQNEVSNEALRKEISYEVGEQYRTQQQEMIQTYKRTQAMTNEKHQAALAALQEQLDAATKATDSSTVDAIASEIDTVRTTLAQEKAEAIAKLESDSSNALKKAHRQTRLVICLQNRVRELVQEKIEALGASVEAKAKETASLKEDLKDLCDSNNQKFISLTQMLTKKKDDEVATIIKKNEQLMAEFEAKIRSEAGEKAATEGEGKQQELIAKLEADKEQALASLQAELEAQQQTHSDDRVKTAKLTKLMICLMNAVRDMLRERLEQREQELQLEIVQVKEKAEACQSEYDSYRKDKEAEIEELSTAKEDSEKKTGQIDAAEAQIQSLKSVQEALEREKDDLLIHNESLLEEVSKLKTDLLEVKGSLELKEIRLEELEEQLADMQGNAQGFNRTSELDLESSGKIIHQGDDLRSLEMGSDGLVEATNQSFNTEGNLPTDEEAKVSAAADSNRPSIGDRSKASLERECKELQDQVERLKQDMETQGTTAGVGRTSWDGSMGRGSWGSDQMTTGNRQVEEHLKHVRSIMTQFLSKLPATTKENEDILPIVYSMLNFSQVDIEQITDARTHLNQKNPKKGGFFGGGGKKK